MTSGRDHNSNRLKLNASVDEEWHLLVRVVKKDAGSGQPPLHPGSRCQQDPGWLPRPPLGSAGLAPPSAGFPGAGRWPAAPVSPSSSPRRDRVSSSAVKVPELRLTGPSRSHVAERGVPCTARTGVRRAWPLWQGRGNPLLCFICSLTCRPHANSDCSVHTF